MLIASLRIAVKALQRHKLRAALTMLGIMIGVAAVITMVALGTGAKETVSQDVQSAGTNLIDVRAGNFTRGGESMRIASGLGAATNLTEADAEAIAKIDGVKYFSPVVRLRGWVTIGNQRDYTQILGVNASYPTMYLWSYAKGKFFKPQDVASNAQVAVIGTVLRDRLFGDENPVGRDIQIHDQTYRVVGVTSSTDDDQIETAYVPYTTLQSALGIPYLHMITVSAKQSGESTEIAQQIAPLLRQRHNLDSGGLRARQSQTGLGGNQMPQSGAGAFTPDDFTVKTQAAEALTKGLYTSIAAFVLANMPKVDQTNLQEMAGTLNRAGATMTALLAAIATISLIVGGIGIMNIMMVSVTERTREIGIRRAVGAKQRDVLMQFLVEAVTLSLCGGIVGIVLGFLTALIVTEIFDWPTSVPIWAIALSFGIAAAVGVFFGFYPARRASRLHPIDALRYE
jgi:ABC-type antimicrobial peptide transport system permease subunit